MASPTCLERLPLPSSPSTLNELLQTLFRTLRGTRGLFSSPRSHYSPPLAFRSLLRPSSLSSLSTHNDHPKPRPTTRYHVLTNFRSILPLQTASAVASTVVTLPSRSPPPTHLSRSHIPTAILHRYVFALKYLVDVPAASPLISSFVLGRSSSSHGAVSITTRRPILTRAIFPDCFRYTGSRPCERRK